MVKVGRNDPCPCGSGLKYKKFCIDKIEVSDIIVQEKAKSMSDMILEKLKSFLKYEDVEILSSEELIDKLIMMGFPFDEDKLLKDIENFPSASGLIEHWETYYDVSKENRGKDFPIYAIRVLWERLIPKHKYPIESINDFIATGYKYQENRDSINVSDAWLDAWEAIKYRLKKEHSSIDSFHLIYPGTFYDFGFYFSEIEMELYNAGLKESIYFQKRLDFCKEICHQFTDETEDFLHNYRRAIANSLFCLKRIEEGVLEFEQLIKDFPNNPWTYIAYGDEYGMPFNKEYKDKIRAKGLYEKALLVTKDKEERNIIQVRIEDLDDDGIS